MDVKSNRYSKGVFSAFLWLVLIICFSGCKREEHAWQSDYAFPIAQGTLDFQDIKNDDWLDLSGEVVKVHFYDTLAPLNLSEIINLGDTVLQADYTPDIGFGPIPFGNDQQIFTLDEDFEFDLEGALLRSGKVKSGFLKVTFESTADGYLDLSYELPGITLDGDFLTLTGQAEPATSIDTFTDEILVDISGYSLDFTGESSTERNTLVGSLNVSTSAEPEYTAQILGNDVVSVNMELLDLEVEELRGYFGQFNRELDEIIILDSVLYQGGSLSLSEANIQLEFINNFGVDARIELEEFSTQNSFTGSSVTLDTPGLYEPLNITRAVETIEGVQASSVSFDFDDNTNLADAVNITPNQLALVGSAELNPLGDISGGFDFYLDKFPFQIVADVQFPLCLGIDSLVLQDTLGLSIGEQKNIKTLEITAKVLNSYGIGFKSDFTLENEDEPLFSIQVNESVNEEEVETVTTFKLTEEELQRFLSSESILVKLEVNTASEDEKILVEDHVEVILTGKVTYENSF